MKHTPFVLVVLLLWVGLCLLLPKEPVLANGPVFIDQLEMELNDSDEAEIIEEAYEALQSWRIDHFVQMVDRDAQFIISGDPELIPFAGKYQGKLGAVKFLLRLMFSTHLINVQMRFYLHHEDKFIIHVLEEGYSLRTKKIFSSENIHEWHVSEKGKITHFRTYGNTFDYYQAYSEEDVAAGLTFRHHMPEHVITPTVANNVDPESVVHNFWQYYFEGNLYSIIGLIAPDATCMLEGVSEVVPFAGTFEGLPAIVNFIITAVTNISHLQLDLTPVYVSEGNRVSTKFFEETEAIPTGKVYEFHAIHTFTINEQQQIQHWRSYNNTYNVYQGFLPNP